MKESEILRLEHLMAAQFTGLRNEVSYLRAQVEILTEAFDELSDFISHMDNVEQVENKALGFSLFGPYLTSPRRLQKTSKTEWVYKDKEE